MRGGYSRTAMTPTSMTPLRRPWNSFSSSVALLLCLWPIGSTAGSNGNSGEGYQVGEGIPVSCLNRTLDSGEHITDDLGKLQYIPFATCNETALPLSLHYSISETITCTVPMLPDTLYHLLEFYVHSDAPMTCRMPTAPLSNPPTEASAEANSLSALNENGPPFTPLTIALQGTLQSSHLHIWTDMNVLLHNIPSSDTDKGGGSGYVVAGTAYSVPEFDAKQSLDTNEDAVAFLVKAARDPWTAGHGTKVVRGEPLTFSFHVAWVEGGAGIGWPARSDSDYSFLGDAKCSRSGSFARLASFVLAAALGAFAALYWERNGRRWRRGSVWRGDGILGAAPGIGGKGTGVMFGNAGRINGYGGYSDASNGGPAGGGGGYFGYGGFSGGKKD